MGKYGVLATTSLMFNVFAFASLVHNIYITHDTSSFNFLDFNLPILYLSYAMLYPYRNLINPSNALFSRVTYGNMVLPAIPSGIYDTYITRS